MRLVPVHINHMIRPEADDEAEHVEEICERMDLDCGVYDSNCPEVAEKLGIASKKPAGRSDTRYLMM